MKPAADETSCPLCGGWRCEAIFEDAHRIYLRCSHCRLVFVPERYILSAEQERTTYDLHQNSAQDPGYRQFLSRLSVPLLERLGSKQQGLDFGCGPGPALPMLLEAQGHRVDLYDPFYYRNPSVFDKIYDFICATEVVEHLHHPQKVFSDLFGILKSGGWLGIMTKLVIDHHAFRQWHYIRDLTHVCFFSRATFDYVARQFAADLHFIADDVILLQKW